jgi:hypothetical protein
MLSSKPMSKMSLRWMWLVLAAGLLSACASGGPRLEAKATPACCASLAELAYRPLGAGANVRVDLGPDAQTYSFDSGVSPVAAFRLPATPRPLMVDLVSHQIAGPGLLEQMYLPFLHRRAMAFNPTVLILDSQFRVRRSVSAQGITVSCNLTDVAGGGPIVEMHVPISEPASDAAYLVLATTDAQRARTSDALCKDVPLVYGDLARIELTLHAPEFGDGRVVLDAAAGWYPDRRDLGVWNEIASAFKDPIKGRLVLGEQRLAYYRYQSDAMQRQFDMPVQRVVMANATASEPKTLAIAIAGDLARTLTWHTFVFPHDAHAPDAQPGDFERELRQRIRPDRVVEYVGFAVPAWSPDLGFRVIADNADRDSAASRIGQNAVAGGIVTALPCGLCQIGGCTPDMLVACAAAFSVGAVIGGVWSAGHELISGGFKATEEPKVGAPAGDVRKAALTPVAATSRRFDHIALQRCVLDAVEQSDGSAWREQGLTARFQPVATPRSAVDGSAATYADLAGSNVRQVVETFVSGLALVARNRSASEVPTADASATLSVQGGMRFIELASGHVHTTPLSWSSEPRTLAQWAGLPAEEVATELDRACRQIAEEVAKAAYARWRNSR